MRLPSGPALLVALVTSLLALVSGPADSAEPLMSVWNEPVVCEAPAPKPQPLALCIGADGVVDRRCLTEDRGGLPAPGPRAAKRSVELRAVVVDAEVIGTTAEVEPPDPLTHALSGHDRRVDRPPRA